MFTSIFLFPLNNLPPKTKSAATIRITKMTNTATTPVLPLLLSAIGFISLLVLNVVPPGNRLSSSILLFAARFFAAFAG